MAREERLVLRPTQTAEARPSARPSLALGKLGIYALLTIGAVIVLLPFVWMISTSLKPDSQISGFDINLIPDPITLGNYPRALTAIPFALYTLNTLIITTLSMIGTILSSYLVAYGFARLRFPGRDFWFIVLLGTIMLPNIVLLIPTFILFKNLGWLDTFNPLIVPWWFGGGAFNIFLLRQFMLTIPHELSDAALIDGSGFLGILARIIAPLTKPALAVVAIFSFMTHWNDLMGPLIFLSSPEKYTIAVGISMFRGTWGILRWNDMMAATLVFMLPSLILFFFFQRLFIQGIVLTGLKG
jgi:ABC-type glycerol-3-phosphate transport system permease component